MFRILKRHRLFVLLLSFVAVLLVYIKLKQSTGTRYKYMPDSQTVRVEPKSIATATKDMSNPQEWKRAMNSSSIATKNRPACEHPQLFPNNPNLMQFFRHVPSIKCNPEQDWIYTDSGHLRVSKDVIQTHGNISCVATYLKRTDDSTTVTDYSVSFANDIPLENDFFKIYCKAADGKTYDNIHSGIAYKSDLHKKRNMVNPTSRGMGLDVLILGFDSLSRMTFMRKLPKTFGYLVNTLEATVLEGYNIVGDGTPQALIPILTGKTELELPRTLKRLKDASYVDVYPMIWKNFSDYGYVTAWSEDQPHLGTFTYRMTGFKYQPVDHYGRPFHIAAVKERSKHKPLCLGSRRRTKVFLDWFKDFYTMYNGIPKFAFGFYNEVSHDNVNLVETADDDIVSHLSSLKNNGFLNNTLLIVMSDHGARFSKLRSTIDGKLEERMPFVSIAVPSWFYSEYPKAMKNLKANAHRLSSPFDLYPTLFDMLHFKGDGSGDTKQRGISLFKEIPLTRTCKDASIESHWCACHKWTTEKTMEPIVEKAAYFIVSFLNKQILPQNDKCATLSLDKITSALSLKPEADFLHFERSSDADGYKADLSDNTQLVIVVYQISLITTPGHGLFEATIEYNLNSTQFSIEESDISRINRYGNDPKCIFDTHEEMRKYCYCKSLI